ncbi:MAG: ABC transporter substrate-binding protein [Gaiellales bacterium]
MRRMPGLAPLACLVLGLVLAVSGTASAASKASDTSTLRVNVQSDTDYVDPALAYYQVSWQWEYSTCVKLLNYPDRAGQAGSQLVPEAAATLPTFSKDGRTVTFTVPPGRFHFNTGEAVTAKTFQSVVMRDLNPKMKAINAAGFLSDVVGAAAYSSGKTKTVPGLVLSGNKLTFKLTHAAPDFLSRIALPFFCALPVNTPITPSGLKGPVPAAGPYYLKSWTPKQQFVLVRNPYYKGTRPHRFASMVFSVGKSPDATLLEIKANQADYALDGVSPSAYGQLWTQYGPGHKNQQLFVNPQLAIDYLALNTSRPTFAKQSLRQAVGYVIDRGALLAQLGEHAGVVGAQLLPPSLLGYKPVTMFPTGTPTKADLAKAKTLAGGADASVTLYTCNAGPCPGRAALIQAYLKQIGLNVKVVSFDRSTQFQKEGQRGEPFDIADESWVADYADPDDFINVLLNGKSISDTGNINFSYFSDPAWDKKMAAASLTTGKTRANAYAQLDAGLTAAAPIVPYGYPGQRDFFSSRIGCQTFQPAYGMDLGALCVR